MIIYSPRITWQLSVPWASHNTLLCLPEWVKPERRQRCCSAPQQTTQLWQLRSGLGVWAGLGFGQLAVWPQRQGLTWALPACSPAHPPHWASASDMAVTSLRVWNPSCTWAWQGQSFLPDLPSRCFFAGEMKLHLRWGGVFFLSFWGFF